MSGIAGVYLSTHSLAIFSKSKIANDVSPSFIKIKDEEEDREVASWGDDNIYPQKFLESIRKNGAAGSGLKILKSAHYGEGFQLYKEMITDNKQEKVLQKISDYKEIHKFFRENKMPKFWAETIVDLEFFSLAFPEFVLSKDGKKIVRIKRQRTAWGRFEKMGKNDRYKKNVYFRNDWTKENLKDGFTTKIPAIDPDLTIDEIKALIKKRKLENFIYPIHYPMLDEAYYPVTDWHSVYKNGWINVSNAVPKLKKAIFENQLHIKYIIYVADNYFKKYYGDDWDDFKVEKREEIRKKLIDAIDKHLAGNEAGGRSITSPRFKDDDGNWVKGIEVEAIDNKLKDGNYLPDASAANSEILFALNVDPTLIGAGIPGGKLGAGSGSDKREAYTILVSLIKIKRETTLDIWRFIRDFNGWDPELEGTFPNTVLQTLDKNPTGSKKVI